jgi:RNA polymerase sigma-70 factor (ECF subfamily)
MEYSALSDADLIILLKNDDPMAYTVIYNRYFDSLYIHACYKLKDKEEAQDVIHELFTHLWNKRNELLIKSNLSSYLYISVRNRILDLISHKEVESKYVNSLQKFINEGHCITDHLIREKQLTTLIEKGISNLPPKMREVFELSRKEKLSHKEIASQLNLSEQTVKKQINNALKILRIKLGKMLFLSL